MTEAEEILSKARADYNAGKIARWQYEDIVLIVMKAEQDERMINEI